MQVQIQITGGRGVGKTTLLNHILGCISDYAEGNSFEKSKTIVGEDAHIAIIALHHQHQP